MTLTCIIVEDELMARKSLQRLCTQHESLELLAVCESADEALAFLAASEREVRLILLDVEMPGTTGFELLELLPAIPHIILTTSKTEYAFTAFQYQVTDYLHKPINLPRFNMAVGKVLELEKRSTASRPAEPQEIYIKTEGRYIRLPFETIIYVENLGDYVKVVTATQTHVVHTTMKYLEEKLGKRFLRVHRSFIVHLDKIVDIEENNLVIANKVVPISRANKPELMNRLNLL